MVTHSKINTREQIVRETIRQIARQGLNDLTFEAIARRCRITQPAIFHYFKNKNSLIAGAIEQIVKDNHAHVESLFKGHQSAIERLRLYFYGNLSWSLEEPEQAKTLMLLMYMGTFDLVFASQLELLFLQARRRLEDWILAGRREHLIASKRSAAELAASLHLMLVGSFVCFLNTSLSKRVSARKTMLKKANIEWSNAIHSILQA